MDADAAEVRVDHTVQGRQHKSVSGSFAGSITVAGAKTDCNL